MRFSIPGIAAVVLVMLSAASGARAADPQSYRVGIAATGDGALDSTLRATSELAALRDAAPVSPFGLIARARGDVERLKTVLESYGYYESAVTVKIEGLALANPTLVEALGALPRGRDADVAITFTMGPLYHVRSVDLDGDMPASAKGEFTLKSGMPAVAADVLAAGARLLSTLQEQGYAFAKVDPPVAYQDQTQPVLDVVFHVDTGARVTIGKIEVKGLQRVHERFVRRRLTLRPGQRYSPRAVEAARRDLLGLGPFAAINVQLGTAADAGGGVPVTFVVRERPRHAVSVSAAYSTDLGGSGGVTWSDRNVFGNAETLTIATNVLNLGGSAANGIGYDVKANFTVPDVGHRDQSLQVSLGAIRQSLQAYDQKAVTGGVALSRKLSSVWSASVGVTAAEEQIMQQANEQIVLEKVTYNYTLLALPLGVSYDSTDLASPLDDPVHGMRNSLSVAPTQSLGHPSASFIISQIKLAAYVDLHDVGFNGAGRSVLAMRALAGLAQGAGEYSLPPDQRFYGGGSGTIRGYTYQSVGPIFTTQKVTDNMPVTVNGQPVFVSTGIPIGGTAIAAGSLEFRQRFGANWGAAMFVDAGQVSAKLKILPSDVRVGVGAGMRYYTPIGPVRLDVAVPTRRDSEGNSFQVYIGLGQAF